MLKAVFSWVFSSVHMSKVIRRRSPENMEATTLTLHKGRQFEEEKIKTIKCHFKKTSLLRNLLPRLGRVCVNVILCAYDVVQLIRRALLYRFTFSSHQWDLNVCVLSGPPYLMFSADTLASPVTAKIHQYMSTIHFCFETAWFTFKGAISKS